MKPLISVNAVNAPAHTVTSAHTVTIVHTVHERVRGIEGDVLPFTPLNDLRRERLARHLRALLFGADVVGRLFAARVIRRRPLAPTSPQDGRTATGPASAIAPGGSPA